MVARGQRGQPVRGFVLANGEHIKIIMVFFEFVRECVYVGQSVCTASCTQIYTYIL